MDLRAIRRQLASRGAVSGVGLGLAVALLTAVTPVAASAATASPSGRVAAAGDGAPVVLVGQFDEAQEAAAWRLVDGGVTGVDVGVEAVGPATQLVLLTVSALDGPMPATREAVSALDVAALQRLAVVLTNSDDQGDPELLQLVILETTALLADAGVEASGFAVLEADAADYVARVAELLASPATDEATDPGASGAIVLIGHPEHGQEDAAARLQEAGLEDVAVGVGSVGEATELVLVTVSALDGPMPGTRRALEALGGSTVRRVSIVLTNTTALDDVELSELVTLETTELLDAFGVAGPEVSVVYADDADFADQVAALLSTPPADFAVVTPPTMPPIDEPATVNVDQVRGVPYLEAVDILVNQGLVAVVVADPAAGVASDCEPLVLDQFPDPDLDVPASTTIVLTVPAPDPALFDESCAVTEFATQDEFDQFIDEILAQPGVTDG